MFEWTKVSVVVTDSSISLIVGDFYSSVDIGTTSSKRVPLPKTSVLVGEIGIPPANCTLRDILILSTSASQSGIPTVSPFSSNIPTSLPFIAMQSQVPSLPPPKKGFLKYSRRTHLIYTAIGNSTILSIPTQLQPISGNAFASVGIVSLVYTVRLEIYAQGIIPSFGGILTIQGGTAGCLPRASTCSIGASAPSIYFDYAGNYSIP